MPFRVNKIQKKTHVNILILIIFYFLNENLKQIIDLWVMMAHRSPPSTLSQFDRENFSICKTDIFNTIKFCARFLKTKHKLFLSFFIGFISHLSWGKEEINEW